MESRRLLELVDVTKPRYRRLAGGRKEDGLMCVPAVVRMLFVVLVAVGSVRVALAQEAVNYASVSGRVTDPQGAVVPGAQVVARQTETNQTREVVTDRRRTLPFASFAPRSL